MWTFVSFWIKLDDTPFSNCWTNLSERPWLKFYLSSHHYVISFWFCRTVNTNLKTSKIFFIDKSILSSYVLWKSRGNITAYYTPIFHICHDCIRDHTHSHDTFIKIIIHWAVKKCINGEWRENSLRLTRWITEGAW